MKPYPLFLVCGCALAQPPQARTLVLPRPDTSAPLAVLADAAGAAPARAMHIHPLLHVTAAMRQPVPGKAARAPQPFSPMPAGPATPPLQQVATGGTRLLIEGIAADGSAPADVAGAVGASQYVQAANARIAIYDKASGALLLGPIAAATVFSGMGADDCERAEGAGMQVNYDKAGQRWIFTRAAAGRTCIALSTSADALGTYYRYVLPAAGKPAYSDGLQVSVWTDAYYLTSTLFNSREGGYRGPRACALERAAMLAGRIARALCWDLGRAFGPVLAADLDGAAAPPDAAAYLLALDFAGDGSGERLFAWRVSFSRAALGAALAVPVAPFTIACPGQGGGACIGQPAPGEALEAVGDRLMGRLAYRNLGSHQSLLASHAVQQPGAAHGGPAGVRWYELRTAAGALSVYQQGTLAPDANSRWLGSMAMDRAGNIALGYSVAGAGTHAGVRYTGRVRTDPPGRMENEEVLVNGSGAQLNSFGLWGHGGTMSVDPVDDCRFWTSQQYIAVTGAFTWRTRIANFAFQSCR